MWRQFSLRLLPQSKRLFSNPLHCMSPNQMGMVDCPNPNLRIFAPKSWGKFNYIVMYTYICLLGVENPSCRQTTRASALSNWLSHTVPHLPFIHISSLPSLIECPSTNLMFPLSSGLLQAGCRKVLIQVYLYANDV